MKAARPRTGIGEDDFRKPKSEGSQYRDKTGLICALLQGAKALLLTRSRRFGKTLNLSMLHYFFDRREAGRNAQLFDGLSVCSDREIMARRGWP